VNNELPILGEFKPRQNCPRFFTGENFEAEVAEATRRKLRAPIMEEKAAFFAD